MWRFCVSQLCSRSSVGWWVFVMQYRPENWLYANEQKQKCLSNFERVYPQGINYAFLWLQRCNGKYLYLGNYQRACALIIIIFVVKLTSNKSKWISHVNSVKPLKNCQN